MDKLNNLRRLGSSRVAVLIGGLIIILIVVRIALPFILLKYVNKTLDALNGYDGKIKRITIHLWRGAYEIDSLAIVKTNGKVPVPFFSAKKADLSVQWSELFHGSLVGKITLYNPKLNFVVGPSEKQKQTKMDSSWTDKVKKLFPFKINHFDVIDGEIHFRNFHSDPKVDIFLNNLRVKAENLTNSRDVSKTLVATIDATGNAQKTGKFIFHLSMDPYALQPTFDIKTKLTNVDLVKLNNFIKSYGKFDVESGTFDLVGEFAAAKGKFEGYVKPFFKNMKVLSVKKDIKNPLKLFWETIVGAITGLFKNKKKDQLAARIPISGSFKSPSPDIWATIGSMLENAFIRALVPNIEGTESIKKLENKNK
jgi:hypothetical protein